MRPQLALKLLCAALFLFVALAPITGSTLLTSDDIHARLILEAYRRAYPDKIDSIEWNDGDWTATVVGKLFYWAHGRLLPESERANWQNYTSYVFYAYPDHLTNPETYTKERVEELRKLGEAEARLSGEDHHGSFLAALFGGSSRAAVESQLVKAKLFGKTVSVHKDIAEVVLRVNEAVNAIATRDAETATFLKNIGTLGGYNWREIRGTARRSYHSWGLAIDITPRRLGGATIYWEWERARNKDWMLVPLKKRWTPPEEVIRVFESEGFVWGGKWDFYDNMHFEYRPELHELKKVFSAIGGMRSLDRITQRTDATTGLGGGELERKP